MISIVVNDTTSCGLIRLNARNLTRGESRMKVRLMVLPNALSGGAWPSSVRVVRCPVKSGKSSVPNRLN